MFYSRCNGRRFCRCFVDLLEVSGFLNAEFGSDWFLVQRGNVVNFLDLVEDCLVQVCIRGRSDSLEPEFGDKDIVGMHVLCMTKKKLIYLVTHKFVEFAGGTLRKLADRLVTILSCYCFDWSCEDSLLLDDFMKLDSVEYKQRLTKVEFPCPLWNDGWLQMVEKCSD